MTIDFNVTDILPSRWRELTQNFLNNKNFDKEEFIVLFNETFEVLRYCVCEGSVNRELIELIKNVSGFVGIKYARGSLEQWAACELTDAMLTNCLQCEMKNEPICKGKWTLLTTEIEVDFFDVENMISKFTDLLCAALCTGWADDC